MNPYGPNPADLPKREMEALLIWLSHLVFPQTKILGYSPGPTIHKADGSGYLPSVSPSSPSLSVSFFGFFVGGFRI